LLDNGELRYEETESQEELVLNVGGEVEEFEVDASNNMIAYICVKASSEEEEGEEGEEGEEKSEPLKLKVLFREKLYDLDIPNLTDDDNLVPIKNNEKVPLLLVVKDYVDLSIYKINVDIGEAGVDFEADSSGGEKGDEEFYDFDIDVNHPPESTYTISFKLIKHFKDEKALAHCWWTTCACTTNMNENLFLFSWGALTVVDLKNKKV
jgi:hypothetical protein